MLLTVDIGNTSISFGAFDGKRLVRQWRMATRKTDGRTLRRSLGTVKSVQGVCVSSVVPRLNPIVRRAVKKLFGCKVLFVTATNAGIKILHYNRRQIGADRLVDAVAAFELYRKPLIIIDFGTATTFDYVTAKGEYGGGVIAPGIGIINDALSKMTAKLPKVPIKKTNKIIGQNTKAAIQSGVFHGYVGLVDHIVEKLKKEVGGKSKIIATGGLAKLIAGHTAMIDIVRPALTLEGLRIIWRRNSRPF